MKKLNNYFKARYDFILNFCYTITRMRHLSRSEYKMAFYLMSHITSTEFTYIKHIEVGQKLGINPPQVTECMKNLVTYGLLEVEGTYHYKKYKLNIDTSKINKHINMKPTTSTRIVSYNQDNDECEKHYNFILNVYKSISSSGHLMRSTYKVLLYLITTMDINSYSVINQTTISNELSINSASVSRSMSCLIGMGVIQRNHCMYKSYQFIIKDVKIGA